MNSCKVKEKKDLKSYILFYCFTFILLSAFWPVNQVRTVAQVLFSETHLQAKENISYTHLPISFEANEGQVNPLARYLARGPGFTLFLTRGGAVLQLEKAETGDQGAGSPAAGYSGDPSRETGFRLLRKSETFLPGSNPARESGISVRSASYPQISDTVRLELVGADRDTRITGENQLPGDTSYFVGNNPRHWHTGIPNYARVRYQQIYPGIDLVYYGRQGQLENDFIVSPGSDPNSIRICLKGARSMHVDRAGDLVLKVAGGEIYLRRPHAYQGRGPGLKKVAAHYVLRAGNQVGFELGSYDRRRKLVIDPVLAYSTYLGGNGGDTGYGIAVDSSGNAYVTGTTASVNFPTTGGVQTTVGTGRDIFVTKLNSAGTAFVYSVFLGGSSDTATGIAVDSSGDAYIVGYTSSTDFPTTPGTFQTSNAGSIDAFLTKINAAGSALVYSTYLGGSGIDYGRAVAVDTSGDAFVTGSTQSTDFPTMSPLQVGLDGGSDAFVTEFNPTGTALLYSTYLGGSGADEGLAIALDSEGNPCIAGYTFSSDFPTQSALQSVLSGSSDAFVTEIHPETSSLVFSTYLGGSGMDSAEGIALDSSGNIYLAGNTTSDDFPVTSGAAQSSNHGQGDAFVAKLAPEASQLVYATYLGGSGADQANGIAMDSSGDAFVTGFTQSSDFPLTNAIQRVLGISGASSCGSTLCSDAFVSELGPSGNLDYSTFLGGSSADSGQAIAVDTSGAAYITGSTASANFPVIDGAPQSTYAGADSSHNAFVAKIGLQDSASLALSPQKLNFGNQGLNDPSNAQTVTLMNAGSAPLGITDIAASGEFSQSNNCGTVLPAGGGTCTIQVTFTPTQTGPVTDEITVTDDAQGSPQTITVTGTGVTSAGSLSVSPGSLSFAAETVGETSSPQTLQIVNSGTTAVNLTSISVSSGDFAETNTCGTLPTVLNVGAACSISIAFSPTATGSRTGTLTIDDDAANGPQSVPLAGTGNPMFSLSANQRSTVVLIGTKSTTFTVSATAPSSFQGSITLSCSSGTCGFNPTSITAGQTSTLTVSGLTASSTSPLNLTVTGTNGSQTATMPLTVFFEDFLLSQTAPSPPLDIVTAGQPATYTVTVTPTNGFNQVVLLSCSNLPQGPDATPQKPDTTCTFSPPGLTLNGTGAATATLTINTTVQSSASLRPFPRGTPPQGMHLQFHWWVWLVVLLLICMAAVSRTWSRRQRGASLRLSKAIAAVTIMLLLAVSITGCNSNYVGPSTSSAVNGTPTGTYTVTIVGTLGNNHTVQRTTTVNLGVQP